MFSKEIVLILDCLKNGQLKKRLKNFHWVNLGIQVLLRVLLIETLKEVNYLQNCLKNLIRQKIHQLPCIRQHKCLGVIFPRTVQRNL